MMEMTSVWSWWDVVSAVAMGVFIADMAGFVVFNFLEHIGERYDDGEGNGPPHHTYNDNGRTG